MALHNRNLSCHSFKGHKSKIIAAVPLEALGENLSLLLPASDVWWHFCGPITLISASVVTLISSSSRVSNLPLLYFHKDTCHWI